MLQMRGTDQSKTLLFLVFPHSMHINEILSDGMNLFSTCSEPLLNSFHNTYGEQQQKHMAKYFKLADNVTAKQHSATNNLEIWYI